MNRREAVSIVSFLLGGTLIGADAFISGCSPSVKKRDGLFSDDDIVFLDEVGQTIIPDTVDSPGAKTAKIGAFMKKIVTDCYTDKDQKIFISGLPKIKDASNKKYNKDFLSLNTQERENLLTALDLDAKAFEKNKSNNGMPHYFSMIKQLTVWGYFSSEVGATKVLRYVSVPGRFDGIIDYKKGDKAWAT